MRGTKDNTYGIKKEMNVGFWWGNVKQKKNLEELNTDGGISKRILKKEDRCVD